MTVVRRILRWLLKAFLVVTLWSLTFNAVTRPPDVLRPPNGRDVSVGGTRLHYERWGTSGSAVVLVHGFAESTVSWAPSAQELAKHHVVYAVDLPGYGYSEHTGHYTLPDETRSVDGFIRVLHLHRPTIVGHSLGAAVAGEVALRFPHDVRGLIFADGDALPYQGGRAGGRRLMQWVLRSPYAVSVYRAVTRWSWLDRRIVAAQCGSTCRAITPGLVNAWMRPLRQGAAERAFTTMSGQGMLAMKPAEIRRISVPRGIIWGAEDADGGGSRSGAEANLGHPTTVVLPGAAHLSMVADPAGFADAVDRIIAGWSHHAGPGMP